MMSGCSQVRCGVVLKKRDKRHNGIPEEIHVDCQKQKNEVDHNLLIVVLALFEPRLANDAMLHSSLSNSKIF